MVGRGNGGGGGGSKDTPWKGLMLATWPSDRLTKIWSGELPVTPPQPQQQQATGKRSKQAVSFWRAKPPPGSGWFSLGDFCAVETAAAGASGRVKVPLDVKLLSFEKRKTVLELQTVLASLMSANEATENCA